MGGVSFQLATTGGRVVIPPEKPSIGNIVRSIHESNGGDCILVAEKLDFALVNKVLQSTSIVAVIVSNGNFSDHARKMLHEGGIALVVDDEPGGSRLARRGLIDRSGVTLLPDRAPVSAICSVLNGRNLRAYQSFGITELGYFRFKFCLFQLFAEEPSAYEDLDRIEAVLASRLSELGVQHWSSIRCVLSDPTSDELAELGVVVAEEVNPDLGLRGPRLMHRWVAELNAIRRFLDTTDMEVQICAPFISKVDEYLKFEASVAECDIDRDRVSLGLTCEVPAMAECLDQLFAATRVDFMGIGTSDLFALYNAIDRNNNALKVVPTDVATLRLLRRVVAVARDYGVRTFVCGEIRRDVEVMTELLADGVSELICSSRMEEFMIVSRLAATLLPKEIA